MVKRDSKTSSSQDRKPSLRHGKGRRRATCFLDISVLQECGPWTKYVWYEPSTLGCSVIECACIASSLKQNPHPRVSSGMAKVSANCKHPARLPRKCLSTYYEPVTVLRSREEMRNYNEPSLCFQADPSQHCLRTDAVDPTARSIKPFFL